MKNAIYALFLLLASALPVWQQYDGEFNEGYQQASDQGLDGLTVGVGWSPIPRFQLYLNFVGLYDHSTTGSFALSSVGLTTVNSSMAEMLIGPRFFAPGLLRGHLLGQSAPGKWQSALILEVKKQQDSTSAKNGNSSIERYEVSLRVNDTDYVALYTPSPGAHGFQYTAGIDKLVLVESQTITINDLLGRPIKMPIISQKAAPPRSNR